MRARALRARAPATCLFLSSPGARPPHPSRRAGARARGAGAMRAAALNPWRGPREVSATRFTQHSHRLCSMIERRHTPRQCPETHAGDPTDEDPCHGPPGAGADNRRALALVRNVRTGRARHTAPQLHAEREGLTVHRPGVAPRRRPGGPGLPGRAEPCHGEGLFTHHGLRARVVEAVGPRLQRRQDAEVRVAPRVHAAQALHRLRERAVLGGHEVRKRYPARPRDALAAVDEDHGGGLREGRVDEVHRPAELLVELVAVEEDVVPQAEREVLWRVLLPVEVLRVTPAIDHVGHAVGLEQLPGPRGEVVPEIQSPPDEGDHALGGVQGRR
mmetsp:Transcript_25605/g.85833  ORF Transcript_25605/g.85833 Transcript_25605/m.85833 type:complete len:330 (+) Transcript_25605:346-1335(+)